MRPRRNASDNGAVNLEGLDDDVGFNEAEAERLG